MSDLTWTNVRVRLGDLAPWPRNPRQIKGREAERLAESFDQFGQVETIAIGPFDAQGKAPVYNGHQRLAVLLKAHGKGFEVDARQSSRPLTEKEREKLTVYLHRGAAGEWAWSDDWNGFDVDDLLNWGFEAAELGIDDSPRKDVDAEPQIDRAEELRQKWQVEPGQLWALGDHRLICGDCTDPATVARVMGGERAALCFTSPPYNAGKTPTEEKLGLERKYKDYTDDLSGNDYLSLLGGFTSCALGCCEYALVNLQMLSGNKRAFVDYLYSYRDHLADVAIWDKQHAQPAMAENVLNSRFEFLLFLNSKTPATRALPGSFRGTVDNVYSGSPQRSNVVKSAVHSATMPLDLPVWALENFTGQGATVYEPFSGSGTTLIACEQLGRKCRAVEISPGYVAVALQRWADATNGVPELLEP